jgi:hypothetical protein
MKAMRHAKLRVLMVALIAALAGGAVYAQQSFFQAYGFTNTACLVQSGSGSPEGVLTGKICDLFVRADGPPVLYLKTAGTGNTGWTAAATSVLATPVWLGAAICDDTTPISQWSLPAADAAVAACLTGTNVQRAVLNFADAGEASAETQLHLPADWVGDVGLAVWWQSAATTGAAVWQVEAACAADGEAGDPAYAAVDTLADTTKGTGGQLNVATFDDLDLATAGCGPSDMLHLKVYRDPADAGDTLGATASFIGAELIIRRQL